jgi:hypothetical protein
VIFSVGASFSKTPLAVCVTGHHCKGPAGFCAVTRNDIRSRTLLARLPTLPACCGESVDAAEQSLRITASSPTRCDPGKGPTDTDIVKGHLLRPGQASEFARVVADGFI